VRTAAALCLLALVASGCGATKTDSAKKFKGEQQKVAAVVEALEKAARQNKPKDVCTKLLSPTLLATLKQQETNCNTAVKEAFADADSLDLSVDAVTLDGAKATAKVISGTGSNEKTDTLDFQHVGTTWKISSLET
jgi:hypothetical protein